MLKRKKKIISLKPIDVNRLKFIYFTCIAIIVCLSGRIFNLQLFNANNLKYKAVALQTQKINSLKKRRSIVDKNNRLIAFDKPLYKLWAHPRYFKFPGDTSRKIRSVEEVVERLSLILNIDEKLISSKFTNNNYGVKLFEDLNEEQARNIKNLGISGLDLEIYSKRFYPQGNVFANLIGFVNDENIPSAGIELHLDKEIKIVKKSNLLQSDRDGTPLPDSSGPNDFIVDDKKIVLTIDSRLQKISFNSLAKQVHKWKAKKGFALVMNVNNGEILSLSSFPSYDPNKFWEYDQNIFKNWYLQDLFEPGSTFKPINLAFALEEKVIKKDGLVNDHGFIQVGVWSLSNWDKKGNGLINYPKVLQVSSNVGMVKIMKNLNPISYWDWLRKLGIDKKIKTDLYESTPGYLKSRDNFINQPIEQAVASFGKGFSISPMKLAQLHAVLANGGYEVTPHVTADFKKNNMNLPKKKFFSEDVSETILEWMESVVDKGSGRGAKVEGYRIGGKTGTSQKALNGVYTDKKVCSFVATLPIDNPKYLVLVVVDEPSKSYAYGSTVAVPVVKEIIESLIVIEKIPPTEINNEMIVRKP